MFSTNFCDEHPGVTVLENTTSASYLKASNYHYFQPQILVQLRILTVDVSFSFSRTTQTCCGPHLLSFLVQNKKLWLSCLTLSSRGKEMKIVDVMSFKDPCALYELCAMSALSLVLEICTWYLIFLGSWKNFISSWYRNHMKIKMVFNFQPRAQAPKKKPRDYLHASIIQLPCFLALFYKSILCNAVNITDWFSLPPQIKTTCPVVHCWRDSRGRDTFPFNVFVENSNRSTQRRFPPKCIENTF